MWDFSATVRLTTPIRKYQPDMPIEPTKLHAILEMACAAPSAGDLQSYQIIVVRDLADRQALVQAAHQQSFIAEAPVCLVFCADPTRSNHAFGERGAKVIRGAGRHHRRSLRTTGCCCCRNGFHFGSAISRKTGSARHLT